MRVLQAIRNSAGALCLALTPLSAALAVPPEVIGPFHDEGQAAVADCGSFQVLDRYVADYYLRLFYDKQGQLVKMIEQVEGTDTFVNSVTGKEYPTKFHNMVFIDPALGLGANHGIIYRLTVPGMGLVFVDVGRIITNQAGTVITFQAGPHQLFAEDFSGLCAALQ